MTVTKVVVPGPTYRMIPSRYPPISAFEALIDADDLPAVLELEGWTNDRMMPERLARLPKDNWVFGVPNASVIMAAFLHAPATGTRFASGDLGAWYASLAERTAIAEVGHHLRREAINTRLPSLTMQYRTYAARLDGNYEDIRRMRTRRPELYAPDSYAASQVYGERVRATGGDGIIYSSVRHTSGTNVVAFQPKNIHDVVMGTHYELIAPVSGKIIACRLPA